MENTAASIPEKKALKQRKIQMRIILTRRLFMLEVFYTSSAHISGLLRVPVFVAEQVQKPMEDVVVEFI